MRKNIIYKDHIFENYKIDKNGDVYNLNGRKLKIYKNGKGEFVKMYMNGVSKSFHIHELLAYTFRNYQDDSGDVIAFDDNKKVTLKNIEILLPSGYAKLYHDFQFPRFLICENKMYTDYMIDTDGRILNLKKKIIISPQTSGGGYIFMCIHTKTKMLHRLLYNTYKGELKNGLEINHKDGIKDNNSLDNLEQVTCSENIQHAVDHGLIETFDDEYIDSILELYYNHEGKKHIANKLGISYNTVRYITSKYADNEKRPSFVNRSIFDLDTIKRIFKLRSQGLTMKKISNIIGYGNTSTISYTLNSQKYKNLFDNN